MSRVYSLQELLDLSKKHGVKDKVTFIQNIDHNKKLQYGEGRGREERRRGG
jgi:hypothetical protein